ncbi:MAG: Na+/H+ antiporter subunit B [Gammaproteobacteria bacterium]|jgi:multicomponent Na+:H+ antiporter subunit B
MSGRTPTSLILQTAAQLLLPLLLLLSVFLLLRGHHEPGGGFIGGLVASVAIALHLFASDIRSARRVLRIDPRTLMGAGLLVALAAAFWGPLSGGSMFAGRWLHADLPLLGEVHLGTPLLFDFGVYLVVIGAVLTFVLTLAEVEEDA